MKSAFLKCYGNVAAVVFLTSLCRVQAATRPLVTRLAQGQAVPIHTGAKVASLDPHKTSGASENEPSTFLNMSRNDASTHTSFYRSPAFAALLAKSATATGDAQRARRHQQTEAQRERALVAFGYRISLRLVEPWGDSFTGKDPHDRKLSIISSANTNLLPGALATSGR